MFSDSLIPLNTDPASPNLEDVYEKIFDNNSRKNISYGNQDKDEKDGNVKTLCLSQKLRYTIPQNSTGIFKYLKDIFSLDFLIFSMCVFIFLYIE